MTPLITWPQYYNKVLLTLEEGWSRGWKGTWMNFQLVLYSLSFVVLKGLCRMIKRAKEQKNSLYISLNECQYKH